MRLSKKNASAFLSFAFMLAACATIIAGPRLVNRLSEFNGYQGGWTPENPATSGGISPTFFPQQWRGKGEGKSRYLYQDYEAVNGKPYTPRKQGKSPSCVGHATAAAVDFVAAVDIHTKKDAERAPPSSIDASVIYGLSRQEIGGLGSKAGGGSHNYWAARAVVEYGAVAMLRYPGLDLREYKTSRAQKYGAYGVPDRLERISRRHPIAGYIRIKSWKDLRDAVNAGCPVIIGSSQGFGKGKLRRDSDGFLNPPTRLFRRSVWKHSMVCIGMSDEGRKGALILNSWGTEWISGPQREGGEPEGSFWADASIIDSMVAHGDSWALIGFKGWKKLNIWSPQ